MKRSLGTLAILASLGTQYSPGQTQVDLKSQAKDVDFTGASFTKPTRSGSTLPNTCSPAELFFVVGAPSGANLYACTAQDTWTLETGAGGVSGLTAHALVTASGPASIQTANSGATMDAAGNITIPGTISTGSGGTGPGFVALPQGTTPAQTAFPANSFSLIGNPSITSKYQWVVPAADAAGAVISNGGGTPGQLSIKPLQGTDARVLSAGAVSGIGAALCTDANGGATTSGCNGSILSSTGTGFYPVYGYSGAGATNAGISANEVHFTMFLLPAVITVRSIVWRPGSASADTGHTAWGIYDSSCALVANGQSATVAGTGTGTSKSAAFATPITLSPGVYFLARSSDSTAAYSIASAAMNGTGTTGAVDLFNMVFEQGSTMQSFLGSASAGTTTITMPATCGTRSLLAGDIPLAGLLP